MRTTVLCGPGHDPNIFLTDYLTNSQHYAVLERIGRSRHHGEASASPNPLFHAFNMKAKDMGYILKILQLTRVIKRQITSVELSDKSVNSVTSSLIMFNKLNESSVWYTRSCPLVKFLSEKPGREATCTEIGKKFPSTPMKRTLRAFPGVFEAFDKAIENPRYKRFMKVFEKEKEKERNSATEIDDFLAEPPLSSDGDDYDDDDMIKDATLSSEDDHGEKGGQFDPELNAKTSVKYRSNVTASKPRQFVTQRCYRLSSNVVVWNGEGDWRFADGGDDADDDNEDACEAGRVYDVEYVQKSHLRSLTHHVLTLVRLAGEHGITSRDISAQLAVDYKDLGRLLEKLKNTKLINCVMLNEGKVRRYLYLWPGVEHQSNADYELFQSLSGVSFTYLLDERGTKMVGTNSVKRLNMILKALSDCKVMRLSEIVSLVRAREKSDELAHKADNKFLAKALELLASLGALKIHSAQLFENFKTLKFFCDRSVKVPDDPILICHIENARQLFKHRPQLGPKKQRRTELSGTDNESSHSNDQYSASDDESERKRKKKRSRKRNLSLTRQKEPSNKKRKKSAAVGIEPSDENQVGAGAPTMDDARKIMTYRVGALNYYGFQGKSVRRQLLHEFLCYWILYHKGSLVRKPKLEPKNTNGQPPVYSDDMSWRRYVPPVPSHTKLGLPCHWFTMNDLIESLPISLVLMICGTTHTIDGLADILTDPFKRHYPMKHLPVLIRLALKSEKRIPAVLSILFHNLCIMGLVSCGFRIRQGFYNSLVDSTYYLHTSCSVMDTSPTPPVFRVVAQPMSRYKRYEYSFEEGHEMTELFWLHIRAVCHSSRLNRRSCKWPADLQFVKDFPKARVYTPSMVKVNPKPFNAVEPPGQPIEPRIGVAGFHPILFLFRDTHWRMNCSEIAIWFMNDMRDRLVKYGKHIRERVDCLHPGWTGFSQGFVLSGRQLVSHNVFRTPRRYLPSAVAPIVRAGVRSLNKQEAKRMKQERIEKSVVRTNLKRTVYTERHRRVMMMTRATALLISPGIRFWVNREIAQELVHKFFPDLRNQSIYQLLALSLRDTYTSNDSYDEMLQMSKQLKMNREIREMLNSYKNGQRFTMEDKTELFKRIFEKTVCVFTTGSSLLAEGVPLESLLKEFTLATKTRPKLPSDVRTVDDIMESSIFSVYISSLSLSRRDGAMTAQCVDIFKKYPMRVLCNVLNRMKHDLLVTPRFVKFAVPLGVVDLGATANDDVDVDATATSSAVAPDPNLDAVAQADGDATTSSAVGGGNVTSATMSSGVAANAPVEPVPRLSGTRRELYLTFHYRHFFFHKYHVNFTEQALNFYDFIVSQSEHSCSALDEVPGYVPVIVALLANKQADLSIRLPDSLLIVSESRAPGRGSVVNDDDSSASSPTSGDSDSGDDDDDEDDDAKRRALQLAKAKTRLTTSSILQRVRVHQLRCEEKRGTTRSKRSRFTARSQDLGLNPANVSVRSRPSAAEQRNAQITLGRRAERRLMHHVEQLGDAANDDIIKESRPAADDVIKSRFTTDDVTEPRAQIHDITKQACLVTVCRTSDDVTGSLGDVGAPHRAVDDVTKHDLASDDVKKSRTLIIDDVIAPPDSALRTTNDVIVAPSNDDDDFSDHIGRMETVLIEAINKAGPFGLTLNEIKNTCDWGTSAELALQRLLIYKKVYRCGTMSFRYVSSAHSDPWFVNSFKLPKDFRSLNENAEECQEKKIMVRFLPRPWIRPDSTLNRPMFRWLCEGIFLRIFAMPGVTHQDLYVQFNTVLQRTSLDEILEFLEEVRCIEKRCIEVTLKTPVLFGYKDVKVETIETYRTTIDSVPKFGTIFARTPMPDFTLTSDTLGQHLKLKSKFR